MNIIYLHSHDSGRYLEPYGYAVPAPNLAAYVRRATMFRNAYCTAPTCSASRAGLLSGMSPHSCGMNGLAHRGFSMDDYSKHLSAWLKRHGYLTVLSGEQHEAGQPQTIGYDLLLTYKNRHPDSEIHDLNSARCAAKFISEAPEGRPFFLACGFFNTHRPYREPQIDPGYVQPPFPVADNAENRADFAGYIRSAKIMDECMGIVLDALKNSGQENNTIVLITTDHGLAMPFMKCSLYDTGIGVNMIMNYPGNPAAGRVTDALVSHIDVFPTLCELASLPKPDWLQGVSAVPVFENVKREVREEIFAEVTYHAAYEPMRCIRTKRHKLIKYFDWHNDFIPSNTDESDPKKLLVDGGWLDYQREREQLYDLYTDPVERINLIGSAAHKEIYNSLSARLHEWMERTNDPLLTYRHRVPKPVGAVANKKTTLHPDNEDLE
ncbi:MAG: sulfatase [Defluviitaleaceae bacterium]|nr:sulfatase [Defluviitaleaceae bacterium]